MGTFNDPNGDGFHNFSGSDESNAVFLNAGQELIVFLNWDDWFSSNQDYDLYIVDSSGAIVAASEGFQTGFQNPTEAAGFAAPAAGTYHVLIRRFSATRNVQLEMFFRSPRELQYIVPASSVSIPADTDGVVAAGATFFGNDVIEFFSSQGPTKDGRTKPDLTAPDGVATRSYGDLGFDFFGTSASAPHAAGAMALMKSRFGIFDLEQIREILLGRALDRGAAGFDNIYGRGRLDVKGQ
jgi:subtilisin family serine protease